VETIKQRTQKKMRRDISKSVMVHENDSNEKARKRSLKQSRIQSRKRSVEQSEGSGSDGEALDDQKLGTLFNTVAIRR
jgi:hypothetical protein